MENFELIVLECPESTNTYVLDNINTLKNGNVIVAKRQTSGRGRFDRVWSSNSENVLMTIVVKPDDPKNFPFINLTQFLSVVATKFLNKNFDIGANIKWPNDILVNGRKIAGILCEGKNDENGKLCAALGIGININMPSEEAEKLPCATSLKILTGEDHDTTEIIRGIMRDFTNFYPKFAKEGFSYIMKDYEALCKFPDGKVKITASPDEGVYDIKGLNPDGTLLAADENGIVKTIYSGDLIL